MAVKTRINFDELVEQNERKWQYQVHKLRQDDLCQKFHHDGLFAKWYAYKKYKPHDGVLSTYFNYAIQERLINRMRKETES